MAFTETDIDNEIAETEQKLNILKAQKEIFDPNWKPSGDKSDDQSDDTGTDQSGTRGPAAAEMNSFDKIKAGLAARRAK